MSKPTKKSASPAKPASPSTPPNPAFPSPRKSRNPMIGNTTAGSLRWQRTKRYGWDSR